MDWDSRDSTFFISDVEHVARFPTVIADARRTEVVKVIEVDGQAQPLEHSEKDETSIRTWLTNVTVSRTEKRTKGLYVILGTRAPSSDILVKLPWTSPTFHYILNEFLVKNSIIRTLHRSATVFKRTFFRHENHPSPLIAYNMRDYTVAATDIGMSVTADPSASLTYAVIYGCCPANTTCFPFTSDGDQFISRLSNCGAAYLHPLLIIGLFVEIQRIKHVDLVRKTVLSLEEYVINLSDNTLGKGHNKENATQDGMQLWLEVSYYKVRLEAWKAELGKFIQAVDELDTLYYGKNAAGVIRNQGMLGEGQRIRERLEDIIRDYENMIQECNRVIDGTSLANGTAWNHLARQDNTQMKSIALLTMVFLPATFVATFFAMPLLKWDADISKQEGVYNPRMKYYWIVALPLTFVVVSLWYCLAARSKMPKKKASGWTE